jgi:hypothetical protein
MGQLTAYIPGITQLAEQTLINYISSSLYNGGVYNNGITNVTGSLIDSNTHFYYGVDNVDKAGPAVIVECNSAVETIWQSRVYRINCTVGTKMIAYDSSTSSAVTSSAISFGGNVFALFNDSDTACAGINALTSSLAAVQIQSMGFQNERLEDAWISRFNIDLIGMVVPG